MPNRSQRYTQRLHQGRLEKNNHVEPESSYHGKGEAEVVPGFQLSEVLRKWIVEYLDGRNILTNTADRSNNNNNGVKLYGPVQYLAEKSGINVRRVGGICNGEFITVPLSQADLLLQAIEQTDMLGKEVQVVPNPNWSPERWYIYMKERTHCDE